MEDLIGLYINFKDNVATVTYFTEQGKATRQLPLELINQIKDLINNDKKDLI